MAEAVVRLKRSCRAASRFIADVRAFGSTSRNLPVYRNDIGAAELVGSFTDPDFDPAQKAFRYARAIEIPTSRWTAYGQVSFKETMPAKVPQVHQERAFTSPIWYAPG